MEGSAEKGVYAMKLGPVVTPVYELGKPNPVGWTSSGGSTLPPNIQWVDELYSPPVFCKYCGSELGKDERKCLNCGAPRMEGP